MAQEHPDATHNLHRPPEKDISKRVTLVESEIGLLICVIRISSIDVLYCPVATGD